MKVLKRIGIGLAVLLLLLIAAVFLVPQEVHVEVSEELKAKPQTIFNIINDLTMEPYWNPWQQQDTTMDLTYGDVTSGVGASYSWSSQEMGDGSAKYIVVEKNSKIVSALEFGGMGGGNATYTLTPTEAGTTVKWQMDSKTSRPWNLMNLMIKSSTKKSFKQGLASLQSLATQREREGLYRGYQIKEEIMTGRTYVINRDEVTFDRISTYYAQNLAPLFKKIQEAGVEMAGSPSGLFYNYNVEKGTTDMAAGLPLSQDVTIQGASTESFDTKKAVVVDYYGDFKNTAAAHGAIEEYLADRDLHFDWPVIEEYVTDPSEESNPEKWLTRIIYYLSE